MKFGRLVYRYKGKDYEEGHGIYNIGDNFQTYAIDYIYEQMGIKKEEIIDINYCEAKNYQGEYAIVLMQGYASHYKRFEQLPTSDRIIPVFFGFEMSDKNCDDIIPYLKKNEPIGCRDEKTMKLLRMKGVEAYTSGCLTIALPRRENVPEKEKVFFVDIPTELEKFIPQRLKINCEYISQEGIVEEIPMTEEERIRIDKIAQNTMKKYIKEATLVVTSRLHVAAPCIAMGIPVILAINNIDSRFSWLDKLIPLYDKSNFDKINWNPVPVNIEEEKQLIIKCVCDKLKKLKEEKEQICNISEYWENRNRVLYNGILNERLEKIKNKYEVDDKFNYIIFGAGVHGKVAYEMMCEKFPNAKLVAVADNFATGNLGGCTITKPLNIYKTEYDYALISTHLGRFEAVEILKQMNKKIYDDWNYFISKDIPEEHSC